MDDKHRAGMAAVLSFLFNGLGQIYNGNIRKGLTIIFLSAISMLMILLGAVLLFYWIKTEFTNLMQFIVGGSLFLLGIVFACIIGTRCIYDAYEGR